MEIVQQQRVFLNLAPGLQKRASGFRFEDNDVFVDQQDCIDSQLLARDGEFKQDSPIACGRALLHTFLEATSKAVNVAFPCKGLVGVLACEYSVGIGDRKASENLLVGNR